MNRDHFLDQKIYLNLFYCFMILFQYNNIVILSLNIFCLNYNQHVIDTIYFKIQQHHVKLSTTINYFCGRWTITQMTDRAGPEGDICYIAHLKSGL
jgi:hypothetical protein